MRLTRWTLFASGWLLSVGIVAAAAWYAIDSAGRQVQVIVSDGPRGAVPGAGTTTSPQPSVDVQPTGGPTSPTTSPPRSRPAATVPMSSPSTADDRAQVVPTAKAARPSPSVRAGTVRPSRPGPTPRTTPAAGRASSRTVLTRGGLVTVTCRRGTPIDFTVNPAQDWSARVDDRGQQAVGVRLRRTETMIEVRASCVDGKPVTDVVERSEDR